MTIATCDCVGPGHEVGSCKCQFQAGYGPDGISGVVWLSQSNSLRYLLKQDSKFTRSLNTSCEESYIDTIMKTFEDIYDTCTGYNMRYCTITGFVSHSGNYLIHVVYDVVNIICFLLANFVVFLMIASKAIVHLFFVVLLTLRWIVRMSSTNTDIIEDIGSCGQSPGQQRGGFCYSQYSRPVTNNYLTYLARGKNYIKNS